MSNGTESDPARRNRLPRTFWWLNLTQFGGAMNDNLFKFFMVYALIAWQGEENTARILATVGFVFALPFILIAPIAGTFADRYRKRDIIVLLKFTEIAVMSLGVFALFTRNVPLVYATMLLMSAQSAFFGPSKYGIVPEQVTAEQLSKANGLLQMATFLAIIAGTAIAPELSLLLDRNYAQAGIACLVVAVLGLLAALRIETSPRHPDRRLNFNGFGALLKTMGELRKDGYLAMAVLAIGFFNLSAAFVQLNVLDYGFQSLDLLREESTRLFLLTAVGIGAGSVLGGWLGGRSIEFGIVPIGAGLMALSLFVLGALPPGAVVASAVCMFTLGLAAGLFTVPLEAFIQYRSPPGKIGSIQAAKAFLNWTGILLSAGLLFVNSEVLGWDAQRGFLVLSVFILALTAFSLWVLPDLFVKFLLMLFTRLMYPLRVRGLDNLPAHGPALIVSNHISLMDAILLITCQQRRIRMLMSRNFWNESPPPLRWLFTLGRVVLIQDRDNPKALLKSLKQARQALDEGWLVCIFAEGGLSMTGMLRPFKPGFPHIVKGTDYPVVPAYIGGMWGSVCSYGSGNEPGISPWRDRRRPVTVHFGRPLPTSATVFEVRQAVNELSTDAYAELGRRRRSLGEALVRSARRNWDRRMLADSGGRELTGRDLLTASLLLRRRLSARLGRDEERVGILLPPGAAGVLANTALTLDDRVTVNLNYTAPVHSLKSAIRQAGLRTVVTARAFRERFPDLPMPETVIDIEDLLEDGGGKATAWAAARLLPARALARTHRGGVSRTATVLFSSGSTSEPKGVMLSHFNLLSNIESFGTVLRPDDDDGLLAALPFFHSFGYTVTLWFPLLQGLPVYYHSNPLEADSMGRLAAKYRATVLLSTPTLLVAYARKIPTEQFASLRLVVTGAERLQPRVRDLFEKRFGVRPLEGYGATELSPACAFGVPDVAITRFSEEGTRPGRIGRPMPGVAVKAVDPDTGRQLGPDEEGLLLVKGPNVMAGYLGNEQLTREVVRDGWYDTGDIGSLDEGGFLAITDRLARFSKIAGEMVPHGAVEDALQQAFEVDAGALAVTSLPDDKKGERLAVVYRGPAIAAEELRRKLNALVLPNLWKPHPADWTAVDEVPLLGSGKPDIRAIKHLAEEAAVDPADG